MSLEDCLISKIEAMHAEVSSSKKIFRVVGLIVSETREGSSFLLDDGSGVISVSLSPGSAPELPSLVPGHARALQNKFPGLLHFAENPTQSGQALEAIGYVVKRHNELHFRAFRIRLLQKNEELYRSIYVCKNP
eukprot:TRINITY_DN273_c0_g1_i5.p2 TRINITY_DN273_c0_g1~~TRINITY_DN273_c0_g1_i5.p2  ORF type:complete len:134 (-),score=33.71 TRINITY_DN273_c0_g1_i5:24-425(-)